MSAGEVENDPPEASETRATLEGFRSMTDTFGSDVWEVAVCRIPESHDETLYDMSGVRFDGTADWIVRELEPVSEYFRRWSNGRYSIEFRAAASEVQPDYGDGNQCTEQALARSDPGVDGVLVVADAQHREERSGGWGRDAGHCDTPCPVDISRRAIYIGAADFVTGGPPPLDLIEHEIGHALGWPHSSWRTEYDSVIDVMSDSSAGRRADDRRRHAPGILAINKFLTGWTTVDPIFVDTFQSSTISIDSQRFAIVVLSPTRVVTAEVVDSSGDYAHVLDPGVAIHLVDWGPDVCAQPSTIPGDSNRFCLGSARRHRLVAPDGSVDGIMRQGDSVDIAGVRIVVESLSRRVDNGGLSTLEGVIEILPVDSGP